ncbi:MFS transporter [Acinetobacter sp. AS167]|uniref:MFS transporter n=1 Tax=Acinetobacter sp. AS167 TaxID=3127884 RepID=UPI00301694C7
MSLRSVILLLTLMCGGMLASGQLYISLPIIDDIAKHYSISPNLAPLIGTSFGLSYALGFLIWGPVSDHYGRYLSLLIGVALTCLATIGTALAGNFSLEITFRILQGLSAASIPPIGLALLSETLPINMRSIGLALMSFSFIVAAPMSQLYAKVVGLNFSMLMLLGAGSFVICLLSLMFIGSNHFAKHIRQTYSLKNNFKTLISNPMIITTWVISITILFSFVVFQTLLHHSMKLYGWNGTTVTILTVVGMFASFIAGSGIQKFGGIFMACLGMFFSASALLIICYFKPLFGFAIIMLSSGTAITLPSIISIISIQANSFSRGMAISIYSFVIFLGASLAPIYVQLVKLSAHNLLLVPIVLLFLSILLLSIARLRAQHLSDVNEHMKGEGV